MRGLQCVVHDLMHAYFYPAGEARLRLTQALGCQHFMVLIVAEGAKPRAEAAITTFPHEVMSTIAGGAQLDYPLFLAAREASSDSPLRASDLVSRQELVGHPVGKATFGQRALAIDDAIGMHFQRNRLEVAAVGFGRGECQAKPEEVRILGEAAALLGAALRFARQSLEEALLLHSEYKLTPGEITAVVADSVTPLGVSKDAYVGALLRKSQDTIRSQRRIGHAKIDNYDVPIRSRIMELANDYVRVWGEKGSST